ncbi:unnamed protein product, partial [Trichogramma brassicae]
AAAGACTHTHILIMMNEMSSILRCSHAEHQEMTLARVHLLKKPSFRIERRSGIFQLCSAKRHLSALARRYDGIKFQVNCKVSNTSEKFEKSAQIISLSTHSRINESIILLSEASCYYRVRTYTQYISELYEKYSANTIPMKKVASSIHIAYAVKEDQSGTFTTANEDYFFYLVDYSKTKNFETLPFNELWRRTRESISFFWAARDTVLRWNCRALLFNTYVYTKAETHRAAGSHIPSESKRRFKVLGVPTSVNTAYIDVRKMSVMVESTARITENECNISFTFDPIRVSNVKIGGTVLATFAGIDEPVFKRTPALINEALTRKYKDRSKYVVQVDSINVRSDIYTDRCRLERKVKVVSSKN